MMPDCLKITRVFHHTCFIILLFFYSCQLGNSKELARENRPIAIMGPILVKGYIGEAAQGILFDQLREVLLKYFTLVSHVIIDSIKERGYRSIDIENCRSSQCVNTILDFLAEIETKYNSRHFFQFSINQSDNETHFSLKYSDVRFPEVIKYLKTSSCNQCTLLEMQQYIELVAHSMLRHFSNEQFELENIADQQKKQKEITLPSPPKAEEVSRLKPDSSNEDMLPKKTVDLKKIITQKKGQRVSNNPAESETPPEPVEVSLPTPKDPYEIARDDYNVFLASQLLDITYSLQVFRIGKQVTLQLEIGENGNLMSVKVLKSSGSNDFDETAILGVEEINFKKLPEPLNEYSSYKVNLLIKNYQ